MNSRRTSSSWTCSCPGAPGSACCASAAKVLILTSHGSATIAQVLQHFGNAHYLAKPVAPMALANCVERFMEGTLKVDPGWDLSCRGTVAVVDDSRLSRAFHCSCMRKHGFRAVEVEPTDLVSTRRAIEDLNPDLVLLDYLMPTFNGEQLLRTMRTVKALRDTPVLIITAHKNLLAETQMDDLSGIDVMFKPVHAEELLQGVEAILGLP